MYKGMAFLAIQHKDFPLHAIRFSDEIEKPCLSFLFKTFGTETSVLKAWVERNAHKDHLLQAYLLNGPCQRKGNCRVGDPWKGKTPGQINKLLEDENPRVIRLVRKRAMALKKTMEDVMLPNTRPVLCIALEDNFTNKAARNVIKTVKEVWPYEICRNPVGFNPNRRKAGAKFNELHNDDRAFLGRKRRTIYNLDGTDINFNHREPTINRYIDERQAVAWGRARRGSFAVFFWSALHQGIDGDSAISPPPRSRRVRVPVEDINAIKKILHDMGS